MYLQPKTMLCAKSTYSLLGGGPALPSILLLGCERRLYTCPNQKEPDTFLHTSICVWKEILSRCKCL